MHLHVSKVRGAGVPSHAIPARCAAQPVDQVGGRLAFDVIGGQDLANPRVFAVVRPGLPDGFRVDVHSFVYTSSEDSVQVHAPDGTRIGRIAVPEKVGNLTFGGAEGNELFICASTSLYRMRLNARGIQTP